VIDWNIPATRQVLPPLLRVAEARTVATLAAADERPTTAATGDAVHR
jgi:hypothetical protein